jgi:hypothetical protein
MQKRRIFQVTRLKGSAQFSLRSHRLNPASAEAHVTSNVVG